MADRTRSYADNVPGPFYVDDSWHRLRHVSRDGAAELRTQSGASLQLHRETTRKR